MKSKAKKPDVVIYGNPVLREKATAITSIDKDIRKLAEEMLVLMRERNGVGLAAQQIGRPIAMCVIHVPDKELNEATAGGHLSEPVPMPLIMINPEISETTGKYSAQEGCLSFPEIYVSISRAEAVTAVFQDLEGRKQTVRAAGLFARAIQHELDHLQGILLVDRMSAIKKISLSGKLKKLKKRAQEQDEA